MCVPEAATGVYRSNRSYRSNIAPKKNHSPVKVGIGIDEQRSEMCGESRWKSLPRSNDQMTMIMTMMIMSPFLPLPPSFPSLPSSSPPPPSIPRHL